MAKDRNRKPGRRVHNVFLCSTSLDLPLYRQAARQAIESLRQHPIVMELFGAQDGDAHVVSLNEVRSADIFVLVVAWRYGFVPDGEARSITHLEYEEARRLGIPRYVFLAASNSDSSPREFPLDLRDPEQRDKLLEFRAELERDHVVKYFTTPQDLAIGVAAAITSYLTAPNALPTAARVALEMQFRRESSLRFRQISLDKTLSKLFVDLEIEAGDLVNLKAVRGYLGPADWSRPFISESADKSLAKSRSDGTFERDDRSSSSADSPSAAYPASSPAQELPLPLPDLSQLVFPSLMAPESARAMAQADAKEEEQQSQDYLVHQQPILTSPRWPQTTRHSSALNLLIGESDNATPAPSKLILEGGPGQGKSTITQMCAQIYRQVVLRVDPIEPEERWTVPSESRFPFRIELRKFAEWLNGDEKFSLEQYLASLLKQDSGGSSFEVDDIHSIVEGWPILLILDGLDEVGSDELRTLVLTKINECIYRFESVLEADLRVVITTRPPALVGHTNDLSGFVSLRIAPMNEDIKNEFVKRWLSVVLDDELERNEVRESFQRRRREFHVAALANNPMQLSILLHFIHLKGEAFPDRRTELYRDYFQTVIDRDVEKNAELRAQRTVIESLHEFLGYKLHALTEAGQSDGSLRRPEILALVQEWLQARGSGTLRASELLRVGEERLGLIIALRGEGNDTIYGFEVQPIREYFAAAFISEQIIGDSHAAFQAMIRRPFWREVAIFLAGLSRPKEKADLIARARELDADTDLGWRQDGRGIILKLMEDGVLSDPPHVFSLALAYLLESLDPRIVKTQVVSDDVLGRLASLMRQEKSQTSMATLVNLLREMNTYEDEYALSRVFRLAAAVMSSDSFQKVCLAFSARSPDTTARVRLYWPLKWGIKYNEITREAQLLDHVPHVIIAEWWWFAAVSSSNTTDLHAPDVLYKHLLEQFAINPVRPRSLPSLQEYASWPTFPHAVWMLVKYSMLLRCPQLYEDSPPETPFVLWAVAPQQMDFSGLDDQTQEALRKLLSEFYSLLEAMATDRERIESAFGGYRSVVSQLLRQPGLVGWIGYRCGRDLLRALTYAEWKSKNVDGRTKYEDVDHGQLQWLWLNSVGSIFRNQSIEETKDDEARGDWASLANWSKDQNWRVFAAQIMAYSTAKEPLAYTSAVTDYLEKLRGESFVDNSRTSEADVRWSLTQSQLFRRNLTSSEYGTELLKPAIYIEYPPNRIRLPRSDEFVNILDILSTRIRTGEQVPLDWIGRIILSPRQFSMLVERNSKNPGRLCEELSKMRQIPGDVADLSLTTSSLGTTQVRQLTEASLSFTSRSELSGVQVALAGSDAIRVAGMTFGRKMANNSPDRTITTIFMINRAFDSKHQGGRMQGTDATIMLVTLDDVARDILRSHEDYPFSMLASAAKYLLNRRPLKLTPLLDEENRLGLQVKSP